MKLCIPSASTISQTFRSHRDTEEMILPTGRTWSLPSNKCLFTEEGESQMVSYLLALRTTWRWAVKAVFNECWTSGDYCLYLLQLVCVMGLFIYYKYKLKSIPTYHWLYLVALLWKQTHLVMLYCSRMKGCTIYGSCKVLCLHSTQVKLLRGKILYWSRINIVLLQFSIIRSCLYHVSYSTEFSMLIS